MSRNAATAPDRKATITAPPRSRRRPGGATVHTVWRAVAATGERAARLDDRVETDIPRISTLAAVVLLGTTVCAIFHYICSQYLGLGYPYSTFLFKPKEHFGDFFDSYHAAGAFLHHGTAIVYTPFSHMMMTVLTVFPAWLSFVFVTAAFLVTLVFLIGRYAVRKAANGTQRVVYMAILILLSYPVLITLDRGNMEMLVFVSLFWFLHFYYVRKSRWAWVFLSAAIAMKFYPATLLVLLVSDRRFRQAALAAGGAIVGLAVSTLALGALSGDGPAGVVRHTIDTLGGGYNQLYALHLAGVHWGHSLWGAMSVIFQVGNGGKVPDMSGLSSLYLIAAVTVFALIATYVVLVERSAWRKVALLVMCAIVLPYISNDYTLLHLYLPLMIFLSAAPASRRDATFIVLFGLLLVPVDYFYFWGDTSISVLFYPTVMTILAALIIRDGLREWSVRRSIGHVRSLYAEP
jgi:hypothetical protein